MRRIVRRPTPGRRAAARGRSLMAFLEDHGRVATRYAVRDQGAEVLAGCALVQERIADEGDEGLEFYAREDDWRLEERIEPGEHRLDRPQPVAKIRVHAGLLRIVVARRVEHIQMMTYRILDPRHRPVVEERGLQRRIAQRRAAELVAVGRIPRDLLQAEILVLTRSIKHDVAFADTEFRRDLRHADHMHLEVAEHFIRVAVHRMALTAPSLAEEDERAPL